ncbi:MAG TPA: Sip1-related alpha-galactosidase [Kofleriaceae bacterium]|nr:Sip1-related alpha-galactosidase [Kofleriaceae bacterium]
MSARAAVHLADGALALGAAGISGLAVRIGLADRVVSGPLVARGGGRHAIEDAEADVAIEIVEQGGAQVAVLHYRGPPLRAERAVEVVFRLDAFARGLALKRIKLFWTAPVMVSDHRLLAAENLLLLWQEAGAAEHHHLILPLAGDGLVGALGHDGYELKVVLSSGAPGHAPKRVPLFACASGADPFALAGEAARAAQVVAGGHGRARADKRFPALFDRLGWCSWNAYGHQVTAARLVASARSLVAAGVPIGFFLVDDGWLTLRDRMLAGFDADPTAFPGGLSALAGELRRELGADCALGVWHAMQGHWGGVDPEAPIGRAHPLFHGVGGQAIPDPRGGRARGFYDAWYRELAAAGYSFVKVDNQAAGPTFVRGLLPLGEAGAGAQASQQGAAAARGLEVLACMSMSLDCALEYSQVAVARNSDDYIPGDRRIGCEHLLQNAYNALWTSAFAWPDWDMFQSHDPDGLVHAIARAMSGGPIYITDEPGREDLAVLRPLADAAGRLYRLDGPGMVTRDLLYRDPSLGAGALKVWGRIRRPGLEAGAVAALRVDKAAAVVEGALAAADVEGLGGSAVAVWQRLAGRAVRLAPGERLPFAIGEPGVELFTVAAIEDGLAVLGLLDVYLGPAAVESVARRTGAVEIRLRAAGRLGLWLEHPPAAFAVDGRPLAPEHLGRDGCLHVVDAAAFAGAAPVVTVSLPRRAVPSRPGTGS